MSKTLVIILSETRAHELTFDNFKKNVIDTLEADLCVCIGVKDDYDYSNPFYQLAKYKYTYPEPDDYADAFEYAYNTIESPLIHWHEYLKIKDHLLGGVKDPVYHHPGSAGILIFFRWFLMKNLVENGIIEKYDRFIITRSDFIYQLPHPKMEHFKTGIVWIPDGEHYGGHTDRHVLLCKDTILGYLDMVNCMVTKDYFTKMESKTNWNLEAFIKFHLEEHGLKVVYFPYIMYAVRNVNGTTRWSEGTFNHSFGYFIKYQGEFNNSNSIKSRFERSELDIDSFYKSVIQIS